MTPENFCYWLQGYFELYGPKTIDEKETRVVWDHLNLVFNKVTPDRSGPLNYGNNLRGIVANVENKVLKTPFQLNIWEKDDWKPCPIEGFRSTGIAASFEVALSDYQNGKISNHGTAGYVGGPNGGLIPTHEFKNFVEQTNSGQTAPPIKNFNIYSENGTGNISFPFTQITC